MAVALTAGLKPPWLPVALVHLPVLSTLPRKECGSEPVISLEACILSSSC